jgi:hypothetical protein
MSRKLGVISLVAALVVGMSGCASTQRGPSEWDGLVRQPGTGSSAVFLKPDAAIPSYATILLAPATVQFSRNWDPNRGARNVSQRLNSDDIVAIKDNLATEFSTIFREELTAGGYKIVAEPGPDTLLVIPAIVDLFISAPDVTTAGRARTYTANSGRMTLVLELRDAVSGETLARIVDSRSGRGTGQLTITNRVTNTADARRAIRAWAQTLRGALDSLYKSGG